MFNCSVAEIPYAYTCYNTAMTLPSITDQTASAAADYLAKADVRLAPIIKQAGICPIRQHTDYYRALVQSIIGQQLSVKAAASIRARFLALFAGSLFPTPEQILATSIETMRGVGFSRAKAAYVQDLARHMLDGKINFDTFDTMTNEDIVKELVAVKGIGEWTAHMFLMFCMARSDVLPYGDLGVRSGIQKLYGLTALPDKSEIEAIALDNNWHPYESIASWYMWQSLNNEPVKD
jgi:DNA-3-methyladenine glycosylase II